MNLLLDINDLLVSIKKIAIEAVENTKPTKIVFGKVVNTSPLQINVEQKMTLSNAQLILTRNVTDFKTEMTVDHITETASINITKEQSSHTHYVPSINTENTDVTHYHNAEGVATDTETPSSEHNHIVPKNVTDSGGFSVENIGEHVHKYKGRKVFTIHNSLVVGDEVVMMCMQGGQKYLVIDRVGGL